MTGLKPRPSAQSGLSDVLRHFDEIAPWGPVLQGGGWIRGGDDWWMGAGDAVFTIVGDGASSRLLESSQQDDQGRTCSQALSELFFDGDVTAAADGILAFSRGEDGPLADVLPPTVAQALRVRLVVSQTRSGPRPSSSVAAVPTGVLQKAGPPPAPASVLPGAGPDCPALDSVRDFLSRFVVLPDELDYAVLALWVAHTYVIDAFDVTPRLAFMSPQKESGKTRAMDLLDLLVHNPVPTVNSSTAALFRSIHQANGHMTLLLDEADTVFQPANGSAEDIRGILNAGYKRGADVLRSGPKSKDFQVERLQGVRARCHGRPWGAPGDPDVALDRHGDATPPSR